MGGARLSFCMRRDGYIYFRIGQADDFKGTVAAFKAAVLAETRRFDGAEKMWVVDEEYGYVLDQLFLNYRDGGLTRDRWREKRSMFGPWTYRMRDAAQETGSSLGEALWPIVIAVVIGLVVAVVFGVGR